MAAGRPGIQPFQTTVKPWRIRKPLPACSAVDGSLLRGALLKRASARFVAAVVDVVEQRAVALGHVDGLEDVEVGGILDHAARVARRLVEIDDRGVERMRGIELAVEAADDLLVGADLAEGLPGRERLLPADLDPRHARIGQRHRRDQGETDISEQTCHRLSSRDFYWIRPVSTARSLQSSYTAA